LAPGPTAGLLTVAHLGDLFDAEGDPACRPRLGDRVGSGFFDDSDGLHPGLGRLQALVERVDRADAGRDACPA